MVKATFLAVSTVEFGLRCFFLDSGDGRRRTRPAVRLPPSSTQYCSSKLHRRPLPCATVGAPSTPSALHHRCAAQCTAASTVNRSAVHCSSAIVVRGLTVLSARVVGSQSSACRPRLAILGSQSSACSPQLAVPGSQSDHSSACSPRLAILGSQPSAILGSQSWARDSPRLAYRGRSQSVQISRVACVVPGSVCVSRIES